MHRPVVWGAGNSATEKHEGGAKIHKAELGQYFLTKERTVVIYFLQMYQAQSAFYWLRDVQSPPVR